MVASTDIDIDFANRAMALSGLQHVAAVEVRDTERRRHPCGVYFHDIPVDPLDGLAVWDYQTAEAKGFFKIDFINNHIYNDVRDEQHLIELLTTEPPWEWFDHEEIVDHLAHIKGHYPIVHSIQPRCMEDLAVCLALIRPGKVYLIGKPRVVINREIWLPTREYFFKRSHALSFAGSIIVQMNLLVEKACTSIINPPLSEN